MIRFIESMKSVRMTPKKRFLMINLKGQEMVVNCYAQLKKYGDKRAKKAFKSYFDNE